MKEIGIIIVGILFVAVMALLMGLCIVPIWNSTMPELFGLKTISWWQAVKLILLSQFLLNWSPISSKSKD